MAARPAIFNENTLFLKINLFADLYATGGNCKWLFLRFIYFDFSLLEVRRSIELDDERF